MRWYLRHRKGVADPEQYLCLPMRYRDGKSNSSLGERLKGKEEEKKEEEEEGKGSIKKQPSILDDVQECHENVSLRDIIGFDIKLLEGLKNDNKTQNVRFRPKIAAKIKKTISLLSG